ncbi:MAG: hydrogenase maturation nickel metallochaperone HypA [Flavobacteriaceae bacterium]|nr:hydrogenase maturation nickel metallochaperone HypA [Bacteroidia bacterium]NNF75836.1 hydrogenase maturation nickel metallochaperone HypA [Flavobacteriaceae bacterium]
MNIVKIAEEEAKKANIQYFSAIELEIGTLAGIELDVFHSVWKAAVKSSVLENAERLIRSVPAIAICRDCSHEFRIDFLYDVCPECGSFQKHISRGQELRIKTLSLPDPAS